MISLPKFKELLGDEASSLSDKEIEAIRVHQYEMAELAFGMWARDKKLKTVVNSRTTPLEDKSML